MYCNPAFAQSFMNEPLFATQDQYSYEDLLKGFTDSNRDLERMKIKVTAATLNNQQAKIKNSTQINLSTGNTKVVFDQAEGTYVTTDPSIKVTVPELNSLEISSAVPSKISSQGYSMEGTSVGVSADIVSNDKLNSKINSLENIRSLMIAERNLGNQELKVQAEFLSNIGTLFEKAQSVMSYRENYLEKLTAFERVKVDGYSKTSSKYKIAQIEKDAAYNDCLKAYRELKAQLSIFSGKCGVELEFLISDIPDVQLISFGDFEMNKFGKIEQALYNKEIGDLKRSENKVWNLSGNVDYVYSRKNNGEENYVLGTGINTSVKGINIGVGVDIPLTQSSNPSLSFNISYNPAAWQSTKLTLENNTLEEKMDELDIQDAYDSYRDTKRSFEIKAEDLNWENELLSEQVKYYESVRNETQKAYKQGIVNEIDYVKAENQYLRAKINLLKNKINKVQYNIEIQQNFVRD